MQRKLAPRAGGASKYQEPWHFPSGLDSANRALVELKRQIQAEEPRGMIGKTTEKMELLLGASGANLVDAGYPYDPVVPDSPK
jgi:hypothetical protein